MTKSDENQDGHSTAPESHAPVLLSVLDENVEWILERLHVYASELEFTRYTSTLIEAWRISVLGFTDSLRAAAEFYDGIPELSPEESYVGDDPIATFALKKAKLYRERGIPLAMFLGLYHYLKTTYVELIEEKIAEPELRNWCRTFIERAFMRSQIVVSVAWSNLDESEKLTELQSRNRRLANEKNSLLAMLESIGKPIVLVSEHGTIGYLNHSAAALLGKRWTAGRLYFQRSALVEGVLETPDSEDEELSEFLSSPAKDILPWLPDDVAAASSERVWLTPDVPARNHGIVSLSLEGEPRQFEIVETPMLGTTSWARGRLFILTDMTQVQSLLTELRGSEARTRALFDTVDPTFLFVEGRLIECNARGRALLALSGGAGTVTDDQDADGREVDREELPPELTRWAETTLPSGKTTFEDHLTMPDGTRRAVSVHVSEVEVGDRREVLVALHDIEDLRRVQRLLESHHRELEKIVATRTAELQESLGQLRNLNLSLKSANEHKSKFLSFMSHELRTPLNSVLGFSELLDSQHFGPLNSKQEQYVGLIRSNGQHLLELVNDLIDISRIDAGGSRLVLGEHSPSELIETVVRMLSPLAGEKSIALNCVAVGPVDSVLGDERAIRQILLNLVTNAIKFTKSHGSVNIRTLSVAERPVIRFEVVDNGVGIPEDEMPLLFSEFHQVSTRPPNAKGTGIGLALSKRLVEQLGGTIGVKSRVGVGSTFWFELPKVESRQEDAALLVTETVPASSSRSLTILVAEDDVSNQCWIRDILSAKDHTVMMAENGRDAVAMACSVHPDVILMDIRMPVLNGLEATRLIRAEDQSRQIPIIGLTAHAGDEARDEALEAGMNEVLTKPCPAEKILHTIDRWSSRVVEQALDESTLELRSDDFESEGTDASQGESQP